MGYKLYFGNAMVFFGLNAVKNLGFERYDPFNDVYKPVLFLGLYNEEDYRVFKEHRGRKAIFWNGNDVFGLLQNPFQQAVIKSFPNVRHACHNQLLQKELASVGFDAVIAPIFFSGVKNYVPSLILSDPLNVYMVAHSTRQVDYGLPILENLAPQTAGVLFHVYGVKKENTDKIIYHGEVPEEQMDREIKGFQVFLRLNTHDGLSQTLIKSVLLGQYAISMVRTPYVEQFQDVETLISRLGELKKNIPMNAECRSYYLGLLNDFSWLEKKENDISLVMIAKNEGLGLEKAILSCIEFVDKIVISVDSKSRDNTLQIAQKYADVVKIHDWDNDFSKARNFAHEGVTTKWILFIDGHEYVDSYTGLAEMLKSGADSLSTLVVMETGFSFFYPRIYRNGMQFEGAVHNHLPTKNSLKYKDFVIKHDRENLQAPFAVALRSEQRDKMILSIMSDRVKANKKDTRALFYLGVFYVNGTDLKTAIYYFRRYLKYSVAKGERYCACFNIAFCYFTLKRYTKALKYLWLADKEEPQRWETAKFAGMCYMGFERWNKAIIFLVESFKTHSRDFYYNPWPVDFGDTWNMISICFLAKGDFDKSKAAAEEALKKLERPEMKPEIERRLSLLARIKEVEK